MPSAFFFTKKSTKKLLTDLCLKKIFNFSLSFHLHTREGMVHLWCRWARVGNFFGTYSRTLDDKNRLQIPTKLVESMPSRFYVLRGFEGCLSVYPEENFQKLLANLQSLSFNDEANRAYIRMALSSACEMDVDSHGRIALTKQLVDDYKIGKNITIIGVLDHFEIWDEASYKQYLLTNSKDFESLAERTSHNG